MSNKPNICIDFDGVLNTYDGWAGENELYTPFPGAKEFIETLREQYKIIIFTTRNNEKVREWLQEYNIYYDTVTSGKLGAVAYIDDRGIRFNGDYEEVLHKLKNFKAHWEQPSVSNEVYKLELYNFCREYVRLYELRQSLDELDLLDKYKDKITMEIATVEDCLLDELTGWDLI